MSMTVRATAAPRVATVKAPAPTQQPAVVAKSAQAPVKAQASSTAVKAVETVAGAAAGGFAGYFGGQLAAVFLTMGGVTLPWALPIGVGIAAGIGGGALAGRGLGKLADWAIDKFKH